MATFDQQTPMPTDVESLQASVVAMQQRLLEKDSTLSAEAAKRHLIGEYIAQLKQQLVETRRARFGRCSAKLDQNIQQLSYH